MSMRVSKEAAAEEVAKATGTKYDRANPVEALMDKYDVNGDGVFQVEEVKSIIRDVMQQAQMNKMLKKFVGVLVLIILAVLFAMFGVSFAAGFALKDSKVAAVPQVEGSMPMVATDGMPISVEATESTLGFFALPALSAAELAALSTFSAFVDMTTGPAAAWVEFSAKLATVYKSDDTVATLETVTGHVVTVNAAAKTATLTMDGKTYPVVKDAPAAMRRRLEKNYLETADRAPNRRSARRGAFLQVAGSFKMKKSSNRGGNT